MVSVVVLGPVRVYRDGLASALEGHDGVHVAALAAAPADAFRWIRHRTAEVIVADASTEAGILAVRALAHAAPPAPVVVIAAESHEFGVLTCAEAKVRGFVDGDSPVADVAAAVLAVARGETVCSPRIAGALLQCVGAGRNRSGFDVTRLTTRERQVLNLIDDGLSNKEIASTLYIEVCTVKNHVHSILEKLGARRRSEAAARARDQRMRPIAGPAAPIRRSARAVNKVGDGGAAVSVGSGVDRFQGGRGGRIGHGWP